jgi:hypothetical protein
MPIPTWSDVIGIPVDGKAAEEQFQGQRVGLLVAFSTT